MGCLCAKPELATAYGLDVDLPAAVVWDVVKDIDSLAETVSTIESLERMDGGLPGDFRVGTKWRENRKFGKHDSSRTVQIRTITTICENAPPYSVSVNVTYPTSKAGTIEDVANTSTLTVQPIDETSCTLIVSIAFLTPDPLFNRICGPCILKYYVGKILLEELEDYARAAAKRQEVLAENKEK